MNYLLAEQKFFDPRRFDPPQGYETLPPDDQKIAHIQLHVAKAAFKVLDRSREIITKEVIPDLAIYRSQLMNIIDLDPAELEEGIPVRDRFPLDALVRANGYLAKYLEPRQHGEAVPLNPVKLAAQNLHGATTMLAWDYDVDVEQAHRTRLEWHLGTPLPTETETY